MVMTQFPQLFKEIIKNSNLTHENIATRLKLSKRRWASIYYGQSKMDNMEFKIIKNLVKTLHINKA